MANPSSLNDLLALRKSRSSRANLQLSVFSSSPNIPNYSGFLISVPAERFKDFLPLNLCHGPGKGRE